ncbi:glutathione peroxidase [Paenibacillus yanchengensis]|uniref:Glutathione peroxidase n=1 Tax=Paenibacillus yanchengensis TaxID=2035833 RepID=A0ABW4YJ17_9BACL
MSIYDLECETIQGEVVSLSKYKGDVLLIVNTATGCGFAPQLRGLEQLHQKYEQAGLRVLAFPCSQFANQELDDNSKIAETCEVQFGVSYPLFAKIDVKGDQMHPLFRKLTEEAPGVLGSKAIKWNFTKFLVDRNGKVVERFASATEPVRLEQSIEKLL